MTLFEVHQEFHPNPTRAVFSGGRATYWYWSWRGRWHEVVPFSETFGAQLAKHWRLTWP